MSHLPLPPSAPQPDSGFELDANVSAATIDRYLGNPDVAFYDARMLVDTMHFEEMGLSRELEFTLQGFRVVPYPLLGTVPDIGLAGRYDGPSLFDVEWDRQMRIISARPAYRESERILAELFAKDRPLVIGCGAGGYAYLEKALLRHCGWDSGLIYNMGAVAAYEGEHVVRVLEKDTHGTRIWATWRLDAPVIDFGRLHPLG